MLSKGSIGNKDGEASNQHGHRAGHVLGTQSGGRMLWATTEYRRSPRRAGSICGEAKT